MTTMSFYEFARSAAGTTEDPPEAFDTAVLSEAARKCGGSLSLTVHLMRRVDALMRKRTRGEQIAIAGKVKQYPIEPEYLAKLPPLATAGLRSYAAEAEKHGLDVASLIIADELPEHYGHGDRSGRDPVITSVEGRQRCRNVDVRAWMKGNPARGRHA